MWWKQCVAMWMALCGTIKTLCNVGNNLQKNLVNWTLDMQWPICYYQTFIVVVLIAGISMEMLNNTKRTKGLWKNIVVGHGLNGVMRHIHFYYMIKTILKQRKYVDYFTFWVNEWCYYNRHNICPTQCRWRRPTITLVPP